MSDGTVVTCVTWGGTERVEGGTLYRPFEARVEGGVLAFEFPVEEYRYPGVGSDAAAPWFKPYTVSLAEPRTAVEQARRTVRRRLRTGRRRRRDRGGRFGGSKWTAPRRASSCATTSSSTPSVRTGVVVATDRGTFDPFSLEVLLIRPAVADRADDPVRVEVEFQGRVAIVEVFE
ncbi:MAG: hypothetical protein R3F34_11125 [Planctomycetota bacterium]